MGQRVKWIALLLCIAILTYVYPLLLYGPELQLRCRRAMRAKSPLVLKAFYGDDVLRNFTPASLSASQGLSVDVGEYPRGGFYPAREFRSTLSDFVNRRFELKDGFKYQAKLHLNEGGSPVHVLDASLKIDIKCYFNAFTTGVLRWKHASTLLRISLAPWDFPRHFDCVDQIVGVLHGNRTFHVAGTAYEMRAGDALYVPAGAAHYVTNSGARGLSILFSFGMYPEPLWGPAYEDSPEYAEFEKAFTKAWPRQSKLIADGKF